MRVDDVPPPPPQVALTGPAYDSPYVDYHPRPSESLEDRLKRYQKERDEARAQATRATKSYNRVFRLMWVFIGISIGLPSLVAVFFGILIAVIVASLPHGGPPPPPRLYIEMLYHLILGGFYGR